MPVADVIVGSDTGLDTSVVTVKANAMFSVEGGLKYRPTCRTGVQPMV